MGKQFVAGGNFLGSTPWDGAFRVYWERSVSTSIQIRVWGSSRMVEDEKRNVASSRNRARVHRLRNPEDRSPIVCICVTVLFCVSTMRLTVSVSRRAGFAEATSQRDGQQNQSAAIFERRRRGRLHALLGGHYHYRSDGLL